MIHKPSQELDGPEKTNPRYELAYGIMDVAENSSYARPGRRFCWRRLFQRQLRGQELCGPLRNGGNLVYLSLQRQRVQPVHDRFVNAGEEASRVVHQFPMQKKGTIPVLRKCPDVEVNGQYWLSGSQHIRTADVSSLSSAYRHHGVGKFNLKLSVPTPGIFLSPDAFNLYHAPLLQTGQRPQITIAQPAFHNMVRHHYPRALPGVFGSAFHVPLHFPQRYPVENSGDVPRVQGC